ncbi:phage major capsid protein [Shouchella lonarensis]|uniref:Phage major capsid protein, HK97 family n=1 Tax=Shouchella lonarensis TaxID=1464122 RepID=A0A1G6IHG2_9BACI|nr:phage major capsid protein [Shouchella lonarensis]SDC06002.1 phage major capsid protein, HK97 family [Shouchella lonarensis]
MLKQLRLQKTLEQKREALTKYEVREKELEAKGDELKQSLEEATTEEDLKLVDEKIDELDKEKEDNENSKKKIDAEIEAIEKELADVEERSKAKDATRDKRENNATGGDGDMNRLQVREMLRTGEYYKDQEVREFYERFKQLRSVAGGELTIPHLVINRIMDILGDFTTLYPLVEKIRVKGTARMLFDTDTTPATWIEQHAAIPTGDVGTVVHLDFDGYKVGKVVFVDNYMLQDSLINLDDYTTKKIARSIALAVDGGIAAGKGAAEKQPLGIIPALPDSNKVEVNADADLVINLLKQVGRIDTGLDRVGEIVAVMHRQTYYDRLLSYSVNVNATGNVVGKLPNLGQPDLVGLRVVFNNFIPRDAVLFGDFSKYTLVERETISIDRSEHVKFAEDQMGFRGKARFDGKPTKPEAFVLAVIKNGNGAKG